MSPDRKPQGHRPGLRKELPRSNVKYNWNLVLLRLSSVVRRNVKAFQATVVAVSMLAWFLATNHCVLASAPEHLVQAQANDGMPADCPMHSQQPSSQPEKPNDGDLPCCKHLRATPVGAAKFAANPMWLGAFVTFFRMAVPEVAPDLAQFSVFLDTGPPGERSFAELVLQRSLLAHAPPVSLT